MSADCSGRKAAMKQLKYRGKISERAVGEHGIGDVDAVVREELGARVNNAQSPSRGARHCLERYQRLKTLYGQLRTDQNQRDHPEYRDQTHRSTYCVHMAGLQRVTYRVVSNSHAHAQTRSLTQSTERTQLKSEQCF